MTSVDAVFGDRYGLHPRSANRIRTTADEYQSTITLEPEGRSPIDARSMLSLVSSGVRTGDKVRVNADGPDEEAAAAAMKALLDGGVCHP